MTKGKPAVNQKSPSAGVTKPLTSPIIQVLALIPQLNQQDLRVAQTALEQELDKYISIDRDLFFLVFEITGEKPISVSKFSASPNGAIWRRNVSKFHDLVSKLTEAEAPRKPVLYALHKFLLEILIADIKEQGLHITLKQICLHLGIVEAVFENQFPGYLKNETGRRLILAKLGGKT